MGYYLVHTFQKGYIWLQDKWRSATKNILAKKSVRIFAHFSAGATLKCPTMIASNSNTKFLWPQKHLIFSYGWNHSFKKGVIDKSDLQGHFEATGLSETLKIHVVLKHIPECLAPLNGHGFGLYSEQAGESIHRVFLRIWSRYMINDIEHPDFRENLRKSVVEFSSFNI